MNDPKAAAAYLPGDAPTRRPDLDASRGALCGCTWAADNAMAVG